MISEMNASILKKEFFQLSGSIEEYQKSNLFGGNSTLTDFFREEEDSMDLLNENKNYSIGHSTRIGVQKGSTLLKALSDKMLTRPIGGFTRPIERSKLSESMPVLNTQMSFHGLNSKRWVNQFFSLKHSLLPQPHLTLQTYSHLPKSPK